MGLFRDEHALQLPAADAAGRTAAVARAGVVVEIRCKLLVAQFRHFGLAISIEFYRKLSNLISNFGHFWGLD